MNNLRPDEIADLKGIFYKAYSIVPSTVDDITFTALMHSIKPRHLAQIISPATAEFFVAMREKFNG